VIVEGDRFAIRAVEPVVTVGGIPLDQYTIGNDFRTVDGYLIGSVGAPTQVVIDYGRGLRAEWSGRPSPTEGDTGEDTREPLVESLREQLHRLWLLFLFITLAIVIGSLLVGLGGLSLQFLGWLVLGAAAAMALFGILVSGSDSGGP
jgi:hypothetical protein